MGDLGGWGTDGDGEEISARPDVLDVEIPGGEHDGFAHQSDLEVKAIMALSQLTEADFNDQFNHGKREIPDTPLLKEQAKVHKLAAQKELERQKRAEIREQREREASSAKAASQLPRISQRSAVSFASAFEEDTVAGHRRNHLRTRHAIERMLSQNDAKSRNRGGGAGAGAGVGAEGHVPVGRNGGEDGVHGGGDAQRRRQGNWPEGDGHGDLDDGITKGGGGAHRRGGHENERSNRERPPPRQLAGRDERHKHGRGRDGYRLNSHDHYHVHSESPHRLHHHGEQPGRQQQHRVGHMNDGSPGSRSQSQNAVYDTRQGQRRSPTEDRRGGGEGGVGGGLHGGIVSRMSLPTTRSAHQPLNDLGRGLNGVPLAGLPLMGSAMTRHSNQERYEQEKEIQARQSYACHRAAEARLVDYLDKQTGVIAEQEMRNHVKHARHVEVAMRKHEADERMQKVNKERAADTEVRTIIKQRESREDVLEKARRRHARVRMNHARVEIQRIKNMEIKEVMSIGSRLRVLSDTSKGVGMYHHAAHKYGFKVGMEYENEQGGNRASGGINKHEAEESVWERIEGRAGDDGDLYESGRGKGSTVSRAGHGGGNRGLPGSDGDSPEKIQGSPWGKGGEGSMGSFDMFPFDEKSTVGEDEGFPTLRPMAAGPSARISPALQKRRASKRGPSKMDASPESLVADRIIAATGVRRTHVGHQSRVAEHRAC